MNVDLKNKSFTLTLEEVVEIVNKRLGFVWMENYKENPLVASYNDGADMMAKYMKDYFMNEYDKAFHEKQNAGGDL